MAELSRALWLGDISFGGYIIPVKLHSAVREQKVHFNLLDKKDKVRLRQQMYCTLENKPVDKEHIVKGFEIKPGHYVMVTPGELAELDPEQDRVIDVEKFVKADDIDIRYFNRYYYLASNGNEPAYAALAESLKKSGYAALCRWSMRKKRYIGVIKYYNKVLSLITLRFKNEIKPETDIKITETKQSQKEIETAVQLVEALASEFHPEEYHNELHDKLKEIIAQKAEGKKIKKRPMPKIETTKSVDLIKTLEKSLEYVQKRREKA